MIRNRIVMIAIVTIGLVIGSPAQNESQGRGSAPGAASRENPEQLTQGLRQGGTTQGAKTGDTMGPSGASLDVMIEQAMHRNPEIRLAEIKLLQAEAELELARLRVVQSITELHAQIGSQKAKLSAAKDHYARIEKLAQAGNTSSSEVASARIAMVECELAMVKLESMSRLLAGGGASSQSHGGPESSNQRNAGSARPSSFEPTPPLPPAALELLQEPTEHANAMSLDDIVAEFKARGVNTILSEELQSLNRLSQASRPLVKFRTEKIELGLVADTTFKAALSAYCDLTGCVVVRRQYGIYIGRIADAGSREDWIAYPAVLDSRGEGK